MATGAFELEKVLKNFGSVVAIENISVSVFASEVLCLSGDNGAGKSTVIKIMSGVHQPSRGVLRLEGAPRTFSSPRDARLAGIATVFLYRAVAPLMSVTRNFFMGRELVKGWGPVPSVRHKDRRRTSPRRSSPGWALKSTTRAKRLARYLAGRASVRRDCASDLLSRR